MIVQAVFNDASSFELDNVPRRHTCVSCRERSSLSLAVAELLYKNQILRFKLSQSQALVGQLRIAFDLVQEDPGSAIQLRGTLSVLGTLLKSDLEC